MDGWLILDKAEGMTSTQAGGAIKRLFHQKKIQKQLRMEKLKAT